MHTWKATRSSSRNSCFRLMNDSSSRLLTCSAHREADERQLVCGTAKLVDATSHSIRCSSKPSELLGSQAALPPIQQRVRISTPDPQAACRSDGEPHHEVGGCELVDRRAASNGDDRHAALPRCLHTGIGVS